MEKKVLLNLRYGNKGQVFILDIMLAFVMVLVILSVSFFLINKANADSTSQVHVSRIGHDILTILDHEGSLVSLDRNTIKNDKNAIINNDVYGMNIAVYDGDALVAETGEFIPDDRTIFSGERIILIDNGGSLSYYTARFLIWLR